MVHGWPFALSRQSALIELLVYLRAARLLAPEPLDPWLGVAVDTLLEESGPPGRGTHRTGKAARPGCARA